MRGWRLLVLLAMIAIGFPSTTPAQLASISALHTPRTGHTATLLADGRVLVTGGRTEPCTSCPPITLISSEIVDAVSGTATVAAEMDEPRSGHQAVPLADGQVLVLGGRGAPDPAGQAQRLVSTERYDPRRDRWSPSAALPELALSLGNALLLPDGDVLLVGGAHSQGEDVFSARAIATVVRYSTRADRWTLVAPMNQGRYGHEMTLLPDGRVLATGGDTSIFNPQRTAEIYDPAADRWSPVTPMRISRSGHRATLLPDGRVLVTGGGGKRIEPGPLMTEVYDPATDRWSDAGPLVADRTAHTVMLRPDGRVYLFGGSATGMTGERRTWGEYWEPSDGTWSLVAGRETPFGTTRTPLPNGSVLIVGGLAYHPSRSLDAVERFAPPGLERQCFPNGHCIKGLFLDYWRAFNGNAIHGAPIDAPVTTPLNYGMPRLIQYFERARYEFHTRNIESPGILLGHLGREFVPPSAPTYPRGNGVHFSQTSHNLGGRFRDYWEANGGLIQFGYPLTEEVTETLADGKQYTVQYFERARFEYHPEALPPDDVQLGDFGLRSLVTLPIRTFYVAINDRNYEEAYAQFTPTLQQQQPFTDFAAGYGGLFRAELTVTAVEMIAPERALVSVRLTTWSSPSLAVSSSGGAYVVGVHDGNWRIEEVTLVRDTR